MSTLRTTVGKTSVVLALVAVAAVVAACGGSSQVPRSSLIDQTTIGKQRCQSDGDEHRVFVVEWDATDSSAFEAKAQRDVVFVRFEGCGMKIVEGCSDDAVAARFGKYNDPALTSGSVETVSIKDKNELQAKLPLGVASFGGQIESGKALELQYFVSATRSATRNEVYRDDLRGNGRCERATHFVSGYNLGAYRLLTKDALNASANAGFAGFGASGKHSEATDVAKQSGKIDSCTTAAQYECRAPIRLTLRAITNGARPADVGVRPPPAPGTDANVVAAQTMMDGEMLRVSAEQKLGLGDASGCLADLDRADRDNRAGVTPAREMLRGRCEMGAGRCDEGRKRYRAARADWGRSMDRTGNVTDGALDAEAESMARRHCASARTGGVSAQTGAVNLLQKIMQASAARDTDGCVSAGHALERLAATGDPIAKQAATGGLQTAARCAGDGGKCEDALALWRSYMAGFMPSMDADASFRANVKSCARP